MLASQLFTSLRRKISTSDDDREGAELFWFAHSFGFGWQHGSVVRIVGLWLADFP